MTYATQDQIQSHAGGSAKLIELTDQQSTGAINADVLGEAQASAAAWMHDYLRDRFLVTPTTGAPLGIVQGLSAAGVQALAEIEADETVYILNRWRSMVSPRMQHEHELRSEKLKAFADGHMRPDEPLPAPSSAVVAGFIENDSPFSRRGLKGIL